MDDETLTAADHTAITQALRETAISLSAADLALLLTASDTDRAELGALLAAGKVNDACMLLHFTLFELANPCYQRDMVAYCRGA